MPLENHCNYNGIISRCDADTWAEQVNCPHSVKSKHREVCIHLCGDNRCDSPAAQGREKEAT